MNELTITIQAFCRRVGVGRTTAYALLKAGSLRSIKVNRRTLILMSSVEELISNGGTAPQEEQ